MKKSGNTESSKSEQPNSRLLKLTLTALGVVYGDIGTSPLYAVRECFRGKGGLLTIQANVLGILSLIFWSLVLVISVKYLLLVVRADNEGEGGILALTALVTRIRRNKPGRILILGTLGLFGAALLYGDGMITPAISVLSAVEGLNVATSFFQPYVIPLTLIILISLFMFQRHGTARIGAIFGPVMLVWFTVLGILGMISILHTPHVLKAFDPRYAIGIFTANGWRAFAVLGTVFLVVTGGEALYADMGHFGRRPIQLGWFSFVFPCLLLNYLGQGALLLRNPEAIENLFYRLAPSWALYPLVILATVATIVASQAVISGAFSLTRQAVQLGFSPRLAILHTSSEEIGQIYVPVINWMLLFGTFCLVIGFHHSGNLAAAYGVAVSTTMVITTVLTGVVAYQRWKWSLFGAILVSCGFLTVDLSFFGSNMTKIISGGWVPILVASMVFALMTTWRQGRKQLKNRLDSSILELDDFLENISQQKPIRVFGTAVFLAGNPRGTPGALIQNFKHNRILHDTVILLHVTVLNVPYVHVEERSDVQSLGSGFYRVTLKYGFSQQPNVHFVLSTLEIEGEVLDPKKITYFLGRESLLIKQGAPMSTWQKNFFAFLSRNAQNATKFFRIPSDRVIELGVQIEF